jgi:glycosyl transferase, family 25
MQRQTRFQILVISLKRDEFRRTHMQQQFERLSLKFEFLDAVDGSSLQNFPSEYDRGKRHKHYGYDLSPGELGCFLSHRKAWQLCKDTNVVTVVFEDDVIIGDDFGDVLSMILKISKFFDFFRLSGLTIRDSARIGLMQHGPWKLVEELKDPGGSGAYVVVPSGAKKLLTYSSKLYQPVDNFLENRRVNQLESVSVVPYPVEQNAMPSRINDRFGSPKTVSYRLRRLVYRSTDDFLRLMWGARRKLYGCLSNKSKDIQDALKC